MEKEIETQKDMPRYEGYCHISFMARVKSVQRYFKASANGKLRICKSVMMGLHTNKFGYKF